jgi:hypothetical protein
MMPCADPGSDSGTKLTSIIRSPASINHWQVFPLSSSSTSKTFSLLRASLRLVPVTPLRRTPLTFGEFARRVCRKLGEFGPRQSNSPSFFDRWRHFFLTSAKFTRAYRRSVYCKNILAKNWIKKTDKTVIKPKKKRPRKKKRGDVAKVY